MNGKKIAEALGVSTRTVRNYVNEKNRLTSNPLIQSSNNGYYIEDRRIAKRFLDSNEQKQSHIPENESERIDYIIEEFLVNNSTMNSFDLADSLYISTSTLQKVIAQANEYLRKYSLSIESRNNILRLVGSEGDKRRYMSNYLYSHFSSNTLSLTSLEKYFGIDLITKLIGFIKKFSTKENLKINDFAFKNLLLHLAIIIQRNQKGLFLTTTRRDTTIKPEWQETIRFISDYMDEELSLTLTNEDLYSVFILLKSNSNILLQDNKEVMDTIIKKEVKTDVISIISKFYNQYAIDLYSDQFISTFSLHLQSMYTRIEFQTATKNPLLADIKQSSPLLFEMATYITCLINDYKQTELTEDETAFIALHIGNGIEFQRSELQKIDTVIIIPKYLNLESKFTEAVINDFGQDINLRAIINDQSVIEDSHISFQLIISVIDIDRTQFLDSHFIKMSPIYNDSQRDILSKEINKLTAMNKKQLMRDYLDQYLSEELFFPNCTTTDRESALRKVTHQLEDLDYVEPLFYERILHRENLASTAFGDFAIPHSIEMDAMKTSVSVILLPEGLEWEEGKTVYLILLMTINRRDMAFFRFFYEEVIQYISTENVAKDLSTLSDFDSFKNKLANN